MDAIQTLDLFQASQTGIDLASDQLIQAVRSGEVNPLKVRVWVKTVETILERVNKETQDNQLREADKYPGRSFEFAGAKVEKSEFGTKYDYATCGDSVWERLKTDAETAKSRLSDREAFLRAITEPITIADEMTGEMVTVRPPNKTSTSGLKIQIK